MATYSTNLALTLMATGEQSNTWGDTTNTNLGTLLEQAISGYVTQAITDGSNANTTITIPDGATGVARNMFIEMTGALTFSTTSLIVPANKKLYFIYNNTTGGFAVTVKVSGQTGVSVPNGKKMVLVSNGTDIVNAENYIASLSVGALTSGRVPYAGTSGLLQDSANLTFNGTTLTANTIGAFTLGGTVAGGGNQLNNVIIGTTTPLAGAFTTLSATKATAGDVITFTNGGATPKTGFLYSDASFVGLTTGAGITGNGLYFNAATNNSGIVFINNATIGTFSSTGLAVTGTLSATSTISTASSGIVFSSSTAADTTSYMSVTITSASPTVYGAGADADGGNSTFSGSLTNHPYKLRVNNATVAELTTTGLAVTGTLSATQTISATGGVASSVVDPAVAINYQRLIRFNDSSNTSWAGYIISSGTALGVGGNTAVAIDVGGTTYATVTSTGLAVTGLVDISAATSGQIKFPATQNASANANTLDDYEEGDWTPTIIGTTTNPTITYSNQAGRYTKIGRVCYIMCYVSMSSYSGGNGRVLVAGLPFTAASNTIGNGAMANTLVSYMDLPAGYSYITNYVDPSTTNFNWLAAGDNVAYSDMLVGQFQSATTFIVSGFYIVA